MSKYKIGQKLNLMVESIDNDGKAKFRVLKESKLNEEYEHKCPLCGSTDLNWGELESYTQDALEKHFICEKCTATFAETYVIVPDAITLTDEYRAPIAVAVKKGNLEFLVPSMNVIKKLLQAAPDKIERCIVEGSRYSENIDIEHTTLNEFFNKDLSRIQEASLELAEPVDINDLEVNCIAILENAYKAGMLNGGLTLRQAINKMRSFENSDDYLSYIPICLDAYIWDGFALIDLDRNKNLIIDDSDLGIYPGELGEYAKILVTFNYKEIVKAKAFADKIGGRLVRLAVQEK